MNLNLGVTEGNEASTTDSPGAPGAPPLNLSPHSPNYRLAESPKWSPAAGAAAYRGDRFNGFNGFNGFDGFNGFNGRLGYESRGAHHPAFPPQTAPQSSPPMLLTLATLVLHIQPTHSTYPRPTHFTLHIQRILNGHVQRTRSTDPRPATRGFWTRCAMRRGAG